MKLLRILFLFISVPALAQKPAAIADYISSYQQIAIEEQLRTGIPAAITMAQAIHESGAGQGDLALKSNNHFGIKCKSSWTGNVVYHDDDESGECFRSYTCVRDSYRDHSDFLKTGTRYAFLFQIDPKDYNAWASGLKRAGYATNPKYPEILTRIIEENGLEELTETALNKGGNNSDSWLASSSSSSQAPVVQNAVSISETPTKPAPAEKDPVASKQGVFKINHCKAVFVPAGTSLKKIAKQYNVDYGDLLDYNDLKTVDKLSSNQVIFLHEKKKKGAVSHHEVQKGETAWMISQQEGIRLQNLLSLNGLKAGATLKAGQKLKLK